jgi:hypothetical protein
VTIRGLDDTWLPRLAARVHRVHVGARRLMGAVGGAASPSGQAVRAEPALAGSIAAVAAAALLVAVFGTHDPYDHDTAATTGSPSIQQPQQTLGPQPGTSVASYLTAAAFDLRHFAELSRGKPGYALVSLRRYVTPAEAGQLFTGVEVTRAYVRVPSPTLITSVYPVNVLGNSTVNNLIFGMQSQARFAGLNAKTYAQIVAGFKPRTDREKLEKRLYQKLEVAAHYEAGALADPATCACVFAVLVHADYLHLAGLVGAPDVRAVDPAAASVPLDQLSVLSLRPDFTTVVPRPGVLGVG